MSETNPQATQADLQAPQQADTSACHHPLAASPQVKAAAPALAGAGVLADVVFIFNTINAEVNPAVAAADANKGWQAGGLKGALEALIADQTNVFPDPLTRGFAVTALQVWHRLVKASPAPAPAPAPAPSPAPSPKPPGPTPLP